MIRSCTQQVNAMPDTLPPLKALRAFVTAARHESFLEAGEELNVSPGAISRHVKILEGFLNSSLFLRRSNGVELTGSGQIYLEKTEPILIALSEVTRSFLAETEDQVLVISTLRFSLKNGWAHTCRRSGNCIRGSGYGLILATGSTLNSDPIQKQK